MAEMAKLRKSLNYNDNERIRKKNELTLRVNSLLRQLVPSAAPLAGTFVLKGPLVRKAFHQDHAGSLFIHVHSPGWLGEPSLPGAVMIESGGPGFV